jgi:hypothetical protein
MKNYQSIVVCTSFQPALHCDLDKKNFLIKKSSYPKKLFIIIIKLIPTCQH